MEIGRVRREGRTKVVTIPKDSDLSVGDYIFLKKINMTTEAASIGTATDSAGVLAQNEKAK